MYNVKLNAEFIGMPKIYLNGESNHKFFVTINEKFEGKINKIAEIVPMFAGQWNSFFREWYTEYIIRLYGWKNDTIILLDELEYNDENKRVQINLDSIELSDILIWYPYITYYKDVHNCELLVSSRFNDELKQYNIKYSVDEFIEWGKMGNNLYASYDIGRYDIDEHSHKKFGYFDVFGGKIKEGNRLYDSFKNPRDWRNLTTEQIITDILGLPHKKIIL